jgi:mRNA interferase MazF
MKKYIPSKGDIITLSFDPQAGHEQKGRRPALIISNTLFNQKTGLAVVCPITNKDRKFPLHVEIKKAVNIKGFVMAEHIKSVDYNSRKARFIEGASSELLGEVLAIIDTCLY